MQASPRNDLLGFIADKLKTGKSFGNKYEILKQIPLVGGTGLGDLFLGNSPELSDDMSYNLSSAIRGGNRATGGLGTYTLDKRSADLGMTMADMYGLSKGLTSLSKYGAKKLIDKSGFDETRRAFLEGKAKGRAEPTNETVSTSIDAINEVLQKPISRRDLMKKGAITAGGVGALAATPSLLRNFAKEAEHTIPKVVEHSADNVAINKYKYNTLKEYLDEIRKEAEITANRHHTEYGNEYGSEVPEESINKWMKNYLHGDELNYNVYKNEPKQNKLAPWMIDHVNAFSPQAKQEMNNLKAQHGNSWTDFSFPF